MASGLFTFLAIFMGVAGAVIIIYITMIKLFEITTNIKGD